MEENRREKNKIGISKKNRYTYYSVNTYQYTYSII